MADGSVRYRFLSAVGEGGFGRVYRARMEASESFHKEVAIKVLSDPDPPRSLLERFRDEARILGLVRDRAIVGVEPPIRIGERWAVVMDFVDGCSCAKVLETGPIPAGVAVEIVGEVARALHAAYTQEGPEGEPLQLLHRDIKPENIQITPNGDVRVLDFGIARANFAAREFKTRHALGGTPGYIAPERLDRIEVAEGDVFSLGVVLHELVVCERPSFPPTVDIQTLDQFDEGSQLPTGIAVDDEDLQLPPGLRDDPAVMKVLKLAAWMRAYAHAQRPSPRQVEDACRDLRQQLPPPYFRGWAEEHVPHRIELEGEDDELVGQVLTTSVAMPAEYSLGGLSAGDSSALRHGESAPGSADRGQGLAVGAMLGGGVVLLVAGAVVLLVAAGLGVYWWLDRNSPTARAVVPPTATMAGVPGDAPAGEPSPEGTPDPDASPADPDPDPPEVVEGPRPRVPAPIARDPVPKVIEIPPAPVPSVPEEPYEMAPLDAPRGTILLTTVPSGSSLWKGTRKVEQVGPGRFELEPGNHRLEIRSPDGERHRVPVTVRRDDTVQLCWDFDADRACRD